ncbi:hypothetical protein [Pelagibius sp. Alg239-R121]|nr:hypothetical protein [Pelagibius sp. Alg239-R121]
MPLSQLGIDRRRVPARISPGRLLEDSLENRPGKTRWLSRIQMAGEGRVR